MSLNLALFITDVPSFSSLGRGRTVIGARRVISRANTRRLEKRCLLVDFFLVFPWFCAAFLVLFLLPAPLSSQEFRVPSLASVSPLFVAARDHVTKGEWEETERLLALGREIDGANSDILYLSAVCAMKLSDNLPLALEYAAAARISNRFREYDRISSIAFESSILIRNRRFKSALDLLTIGPALDSTDPEFGYLRALAYYGLNEREFALKEISRIAARFPRESRAARLFFERELKNPTAYSQELGRQFLNRLPDLAALDSEVLVLAARYMPSQSQARDAVLAFREAGGKSAQATLRALEFGIIGDRAAINEFFDGEYELFLSDLLELRDYFGSAEGYEFILARLSEFSGTISADGDGDGFPEEFIEYRTGRLNRFIRDADQDGIPELEFNCSDGLPFAALARSGLTEIHIEYSRYPYAIRVLFEEGRETQVRNNEKNEIREYHFLPESFALPFLTFTPFPKANSPFFLGSTGFFNLPSEYECIVSAFSFRKKTDSLEEFTSLEKGIPLQREKFRNGRLDSILEYAKGRPSLDYADLDGDGKFETQRFYDPLGDGSISTVIKALIDSNGDGVPDYRESFQPPYRKEWDFDFDGLFDAFEEKSDEKRTKREFSSRLDGRFDEVLILKDSQISEFSRNGEELPLIVDSNPRLKWIGSKPFDLGGNLPVSEGVYRYMNGRYRLIYIGDMAFAEIIP